MEEKFCATCGHALAQPDTARYCAHCGAPVGANAERVTLPPLALGPNAIAFFIYFIPVVGPLIFLNLDPHNRDERVRFHAWQSLYFTASWVGIYMALFLISLPLGFVGIPFGGVMLPLAHLALVVAWILLLVKALSGRLLLLPFIGDLAQEKAAH
jgi:uncharacterized membrane protein